jgi:signal transduction histidine kinase
MSTALLHAPLPIAVFHGPDRKLVLASLRWQQLFRELPDAIREAMERAGEANAPVEVEARMSSRTFRVAVQPLPDAQMLVTCIDETPLVAARAELAHARSQKQQILAAISHDLRSPMSTLLLWERVLRDRIDEDSVRWRALDAIRESATMQVELISELSHMRSLLGDVQLPRERVSFDRVLAVAADRCAATVRELGVSLIADYERPLAIVDVEPTLLPHAFTKMLESAIRVRSAGEAIAIAARAEGAALRITIGDVLFESVGDPVEPVPLQLCLLAANEIVALHGGTFEAVRRPGCAPTFRITIPLLNH